MITFSKYRIKQMSFVQQFITKHKHLRLHLKRKHTSMDAVQIFAISTAQAKNPVHFWIQHYS
jgi:hypothetical protein